MHLQNVQQQQYVIHLKGTETETLSRCVIIIFKSDTLTLDTVIQFCLVSSCHVQKRPTAKHPHLI